MGHPSQWVGLPRAGKRRGSGVCRCRAPGRRLYAYRGENHYKRQHSKSCTLAALNKLTTCCTKWPLFRIRKGGCQAGKGRGNRTGYNPPLPAARQQSQPQDAGRPRSPGEDTHCDAQLRRNRGPILQKPMSHALLRRIGLCRCETRYLRLVSSRAPRTPGPAPASTTRRLEIRRHGESLVKQGGPKAMAYVVWCSGSQIRFISPDVSARRVLVWIEPDLVNIQLSGSSNKALR
jgi:hypothetical protein